MSTKKTITVVSTGSSKAKAIETGALNWGDLQKELTNNGVTHSGMKAVIGKSKLNLESPDAILPDDSFTLFLFPTRTKSGAGYTAAQIAAMPFKDVRAAIKSAIDADASAADHFNSGGKNYTNKSTDELKKLLTSYKPKVSKSAPAAKEVASVVGAVKEKAKSAPVPSTPATKATSSTPVRTKATPKEEPKASVNVATALDTDEKRIEFIIELIGDMDKPSQADKNEAISAIASLRANSEVKGKATVQVDTDELMREARNIAKGLSGIQSF